LVTAATDAAGWTGIVLAAIGGGGIGGVIGGYLQVVKRGRIERAEQWRTRLIEASEEFQKSVTETLLEFDPAMLRDAIDGKSPLFEENGEPTPGTADIVHKTREELVGARRLLARIQLLYGTGSSTPPPAQADRGAYLQALTALDCIRTSIALLEERGRPQPAVRAVLALQQGEDLLDAFSETSWREHRAALAVREYERSMPLPTGLPTDFDPADDRSHASWALVFRRASTLTYEAFVDSCVTAIHSDDPGTLSVPASRWKSVIR
jgi:hypothetical protein